MDVDTGLLRSVDPDLADVLDVYQMYKLYKLYKKYKKRKQGQVQGMRTARCWIHQVNKQRDELGAFATLMPQLKCDDAEFQNYFRMSQPLFQELLSLIEDDVKKDDTNFRSAINPELKLMLTLRYLATGQNFQSLHYQFRVGNKTARQAVYDVCTAIWNRLNPTEIKPPTKEEYITVAQQFLDSWHFPNCLGAIGGKLIETKCSSLSGAQFGNSIVLQAVADANGLFTFIDVGDYGRHCDAGGFQHSSFGKALFNNLLPLPDDASIAGSELLPFVFIGDEAYPLLCNLIKPFSSSDLDSCKRNFNDRLSSARRVVEFAFKMMTFKWGVLQTTMTVNPEHSHLITLACCVLHNFVRRREGKPGPNSISSDFKFEEGITPEPASKVENFGHPSEEALNIRERFASLVQEKIALPGQISH